MLKFSARRAISLNSGRYVFLVRVLTTPLSFGAEGNCLLLCTDNDSSMRQERE